MRKINQYSLARDKEEFIVQFLRKNDKVTEKSNHGYLVVTLDKTIRILIDLGFEMYISFNKNLKLYECDFYYPDMPTHGMSKDEDYYRCVCDAVVEAIYKYKKIVNKAVHK